MMKTLRSYKHILGPVVLGVALLSVTLIASETLEQMGTPQSSGAKILYMGATLIASQF